MAHRFIDVLVDAHDGLADGCAMRFKAEDAPRTVAVVRWYDDADRAIDCDVTGWSSAGAVPAQAVTIEDSSAGTAVLVWGGDLGVRLAPRDGSPPFFESHLRLSPEDVLA